jgi:hypothetical protein
MCIADRHIRKRLTQNATPASFGVHRSRFRRPAEMPPRCRGDSTLQGIPVSNRVITFFHLCGMRRGGHESHFTLQRSPEALVKRISFSRASFVRNAFPQNIFVQFAIPFHRITLPVIFVSKLFFTEKHTKTSGTNYAHSAPILNCRRKVARTFVHS